MPYSQLLIDDGSGCLCVKVKLKFCLYMDAFVFNVVYNLEMRKTFQYLISVFICNIHPTNMPIQYVIIHLDALEYWLAFLQFQGFFLNIAAGNFKGKNKTTFL